MNRYKVPTNLLFIFILFVTGGCEQKLSNEFQNMKMRLSRDTVLFNVEGGKKSVELFTYNDWSVKGDAQRWCEMQEFHQVNNRNLLTFHVAANESCDIQSCSYTVSSLNDQKKIIVIQLGNAPAILCSRDSIVVDRDTAYYKVNYISNINFEVVNSLSWVDVKREGEKEGIFSLSISSNTTGELRNGQILLKEITGEYQAVIKVIQKSDLEDYESVMPDSVHGNLAVKIISATASTQLEESPISNAFDGDLKTYFQSNWQEDKDFWMEFELENNSVPIKYLVYHPRADNKNHNIKSADLWIKLKGESEYIKYPKTLSFPQDPFPTKITFDEPLDIDALKIDIITLHNAPSIKVNSLCCVELELISSSNLYPEIFSDNCYSQLNADIEIGDILAMESEFFRNIAKHLYNHTYPMERVQEYAPLVNDIVKAEVALSSTLQSPMGVYVEKDEEIILFVEKIYSGVSLQSVNCDGPIISTNSYVLQEGVNKIKALNSGLLYVLNRSSQNVKIHIASGAINGILRKMDMEISSDVACEYIDVVGDKIQLLCRRTSLEGIAISETLDRLDRWVVLCQQFHGIAEGAMIVTNRVPFIESTESDKVGSAFIECNSANFARFLATEWSSDDIWNFSTVLSQAYGITKYGNLWGYKGVTDRLFGLRLQDSMQVESSITAEDVNKACNQIIVTGDSYSSISEEKSRVVPLWQLETYFDKVLLNEDIWADICRSERSTFDVRPNFSNSFGNICNSATNYDCNAFLVQWGLVLGATTMRNELPVHIAYLTVDNLSMYLNPEPIVKGSMVNFNNQLRLLGWKNVVAFEVYNAGFLCYVQTMPVDTLVIPNYKPSMKIIAIGSDGSRLNI